MNTEAFNQMYNECSPKLLAKLSSVEIWGSLFVNKQTADQVKERVQSTFKLKL
jgi:hypothetical protein